MKPPFSKILLLFLIISCNEKDTSVKSNDHNSPQSMISEFREEDKIILKYLPDSATWSGHHMKLIPTDPKYIPTQTQQIEVLRALIKKYPRYEINSVVTNEINFIDNAGYWSSISCNICNEEIPVDFWQAAMSESYTTHFVDLTFETPCCQRILNLNDIIYDSPAGFARYSIVVIDLGYEVKNEELVGKLEAILDQEIRIVWANY